MILPFASGDLLRTRDGDHRDHLPLGDRSNSSGRRDGWMMMMMMEDGCDAVDSRTPTVSAESGSLTSGVEKRSHIHS